MEYILLLAYDLPHQMFSYALATEQFNELGLL